MEQEWATYSFNYPLVNSDDKINGNNYAPDFNKIDFAGIPPI